jgi:hypothetical protein
MQNKIKCSGVSSEEHARIVREFGAVLSETPLFMAWVTNEEISVVKEYEKIKSIELLNGSQITANLPLPDTDELKRVIHFAERLKNMCEGFLETNVYEYKEIIIQAYEESYTMHFADITPTVLKDLVAKVAIKNQKELQKVLSMNIYFDSYVPIMGGIKRNAVEIQEVILKENDQKPLYNITVTDYEMIKMFIES